MIKPKPKLLKPLWALVTLSMTLSQARATETILPTAQATINTQVAPIWQLDTVHDLKDITMAAPSVSMVEQGRGASAGFAMRGVDKNRVAVIVDGIPQAQSYVLERGLFSSDASSGAINEVELEHIRDVRFIEGASGAKAGNGALGGAVVFDTKTADDMLINAKHPNYGGYAKLAYQSKTGGVMASVGGAWTHDNTRAMLLHTQRRGHEVRAHDDIGKLTQSFERLHGFENTHHVTDDKPSRGFFTLCDGCAPHAKADVRTGKLPVIDNPSDTQKAMIDKMRPTTHTVKASEYTGKDVIIPNPMTTKSHATLLKIEHDGEFGNVLVSAHHQAQNFDSRDITTPSYYTKQDLIAYEKNTPLTFASFGYYQGDNPDLGLVISQGDAFKRSIAYSQSHFLNEMHQTTRLNTKWQKPMSWGEFTLGAHHQRVSIQAETHKRYCALYPAIDPNCRADIRAPWSAYQSEKNRYTELRTGAHADVSAPINEYLTYQGSFGMDKVKSSLARFDVMAEYARAPFETQNTPAKGTKDDPKRVIALPVQIHRTDFCNNARIDLSNCTTRIINASQQYATSSLDYTKDGLSAHIGIRADYQKFDSPDPLTATGNYKNLSTQYHLTKHWDNTWLKIGASTGFRAPAFYELYGYRAANFADVPSLKPERATTKELSVGYQRDGLHLLVGVYRQNYQRLIGLARKVHPVNSAKTFHNLYDIGIDGIDVGADVDFGRWSKKADGFFGSFRYYKARARGAKLYDGFTAVNSPMLDAIKPAGYVLSAGYQDQDKGLIWRTTYQDAKAQDEAATNIYHGIHRVGVPQNTTRAWQTHDIEGHIKLKDITLRASVLNVLNHRYSNWERARGSSISAVNPEAGDWRRYAAAGRNYAISVQWDF